jgi:hypothetical protein
VTLGDSACRLSAQKKAREKAILRIDSLCHGITHRLACRSKV